MTNYIRTCPQCKTDYTCKDGSARYRYKTRICRPCWKLQKKNNKRILMRNCPICYTELFYTNYKNFWQAKKDNVRCRSCSKIGNPSRKGQKCSIQHKLKIGLAHKGKVISKQSKMKMRLAAIRRMDKLGITQYRNYNPKACLFFDNLNISNGWNLQHALNGGEIQKLGYFLDAYDKDRNVVVEYDEPSHNRPNKKRKDMIRQQEIIDFLQCGFYRYNESDGQLTKI